MSIKLSLCLCLDLCDESCHNLVYWTFKDTVNRSVGDIFKDIGIVQFLNTDGVHWEEISINMKWNQDIYERQMSEIYYRQQEYFISDPMIK